MADLAKGLAVEYSTNDSTYTSVGDLASISEPGQMTAPDIDVTPINTSSNVRTFKTGMFTGGTFSFSIYFDKAKQTALNTVKNAGTDYYWRMTLPDGSTYKWQGPLKSAVPGGVGNADDPLVINGVVTVNTAITFTPAA